MRWCDGMNIGIVLSGGMAKGAYQIGALRALKELVPMEDIKCISCASVGVLNGYAFAADELDRAERMWKNICSGDTRLLISQILRSTLLQQNICMLSENEKQLSCSFYAALFDFNHRNIVYKDLSQVKTEQIPAYLKASVAMPAYNRAVQLDHTQYFDGAMIDNIPVYPLLRHNLDYIICFYFDDTCYRFENTMFDNRVIKVTFPSDSVLKQSLILQQANIDAMIRDGYERTIYLLRAVFAKGYDDLDYVYQTIRHLNRISLDAKPRITGDLLVTNLNKLTQRLTKRKII